MDRKTWLVIGLSVAAFVLWNWYYNATYGPYLKQQAEQHKEQAAAAAAKPSPIAAATSPAATPGQAAAATPTPAPAMSQAVMTARDENLISVGKKKTSAEYIFSNDTGGIEGVRLLMHRLEGQTAVTLNGDRRMPIGALETTAGVAMGGFEMNVDKAKQLVTFAKTDADGLVIEKKFSLPPEDSAAAPYVVNLEISFRNPTKAPITRGDFFLSTGAASPIHQHDMPIYTRFDWAVNGSMKGRDVNAFNASQIPLVGIQLRPAQESFQEAVADVDWTAVTSQYFCTMLMALDDDARGQSVWATRFLAPQAPQGAAVYGIQGALGLKGFTVEGGQTVTRRYQIYAGPKEIARLDHLGHNAEAVMNFNWFGFISKILLRAMNALHSVLGSYAAAIIVLTLIIKTLLWPLQNKATNSMRKMSALSPKMTELREKYKDDPQKMNQELMKLYKDYGVNPFSGCLPMLIQIPIFFGFYGMLGTAIELRNSSFLWIHDLSQPDTVGHMFGFPINILPLVMAGTMVWQMAISPKSGDMAQQRILMFMPIIFVVFAYNYASALSLYWTTQNLFSIVQLYLTRNKPLPTLEKLKATSSKPRKKRPPR